MIWRLIPLLAVALGFSACESLTSDDRAPATSQPVVEAAPAPENTAPTAASNAPPQPVRKRLAPKPPAATPAEPTPIVIVGLSRPELTKTLGDPAERADRNAGQAWVYHAGGCTLEVLFLFDVVRDDMFVIDRKLTGTDGSVRGEQQCLQHIRAAHAS
jgi:hypothetical protein